VDHYSKSEDFSNNIFKKYGVKSTLELYEVKEKSKKTLLEKYGVDHYSKSEDFSNKVKKTCLNKYNINSYSKTNDFKEKIRKNVLNKFILKNDINIINYKNNNIEAICKNKHNFIIHRHTLKNRIKYKTELCTICNPINSYFISGYELQLQNFIKENYNNEILLNQRNIINKEIDIYLQELKLAFEFNGLYWHNELNKDKNYHLNKTEECEKQGIQLIHIWEDDWIYKNDIVKSIILNKLNKIKNKIYARKTEIKEITDNKLVKDFLEKNHIQGFVGSKIKLGLFYENELVSLMIFGNIRIAMGKKTNNENEYELLRFCNKLNTNVIGGASKLFKYFIYNYKPEEITTYADRSFSQGKLYETLGFKFINKTDTNYYYIIDGIKHHRFNFRKDKLIKEGFDPNKTEHEIMIERKFYRIYDSGNLKFIYNKK
jgi:very-short-patch-repair endonuclease